MISQFDIVILGSGTTAMAGAQKAAREGAKVLMVEQGQVGGTCVNWGCVPSKTLIDKAAMFHAARRAAAWGLSIHSGDPDCPTLMQLKRTAVDTIRRRNYQQEIEAYPNIKILRGHGTFLSNRELQVGAETIRSERFLVAVGGFPRVAKLPGLEAVDYLTSYSALHLPCFPKSLVILGGGVIALEMGQMFARFGTQVTILERGDRLLGEFDPRLTGIFREMLHREGVQVFTEVETERVAGRPQGVCVYARVAEAPIGICAERFMQAVGTVPATGGIGLEQAGVDLDNAGFIRVDAGCSTSAAGIWAAGDVTGPPLIAPAGELDAEVAVANMLAGHEVRTVDHRLSPMAVFVDPEFATVGMDLEAAQKEGHDAVEGFLDLEDVPKAHVLGERRGGILLCAERKGGRLLGCQLLAPRAADIIHEAMLAIRFGLTAADLAESVHVYPTISDGLRLAARRLLEQVETAAE
ncbi:MAG: mercury(II) reductase [Desulfuromonas sp.]|nr:MAG: mercury(II) reductase [Desulfuromonas sp.]